MTSVSEDTNKILDNAADVNLNLIEEMDTNLTTIIETTGSLGSTVDRLENEISTQEQRVLDQVEFRLNQEFSNDTTEVSINARLDRELTTLRADLTQIQSQVQEAIRSANQALSKSLARI